MDSVDIPSLIQLITTVGFPSVITLLLLLGIREYAERLTNELVAIKVELAKQTLMLAKMHDALQIEYDDGKVRI